MRVHHYDNFGPEDGSIYSSETSVTLLTSTLYRDLRTDSILVLKVYHGKLEKTGHRPRKEDMGGPLQ
jgi:hypothetical protein